MRLVPLLPIVIAAGLAGAAAAGEHANDGKDFPQPGYWELQTKVDSIIHDNKTERHCYTQASVAKLVQPCNHHYTCSYSTQTARNGHLELKGEWVARKGSQTVDVAGSGNYSRDAMTAEAEMHTSLLGLPISGKAQMTARRLSADCPADVKRE